MPQAAVIVGVIASVASTAATVSQMVQSWSDASQTYQNTYNSGKKLDAAKQFLEDINQRSDDPAEQGPLQQFQEIMAQQGYTVTVPDEINSVAELRDLANGFQDLLDDPKVKLTDQQRTEMNEVVGSLLSAARTLEANDYAMEDPDGDGTAVKVTETVGDFPSQGDIPV